MPRDQAFVLVQQPVVALGTQSLEDWQWIDPNTLWSSMQTVQSLLEATCFDFVYRHLPDQFASNRVESSLDQYLTWWIKQIRPFFVNHEPYAHPDRGPGLEGSNVGSLDQIITSVIMLRYHAIHRVTRKFIPVLLFLESAVYFAPLLEDGLRSGLIENLLVKYRHHETSLGAKTWSVGKQLREGWRAQRDDLQTEMVVRDNKAVEVKVQESRKALCGKAVKKVNQISSTDSKVHSNTSRATFRGVRLKKKTQWAGHVSGSEFYV